MIRIHGFFYTIILLMFSMASFALDDKTRVAFYYGDKPPLDELHAFNVVVVYPGAFISAKKYNNASSQLYAYVSIGETIPSSPYEAQIKPAWRVGNNKAWDSRVMDMANPEWRDFLLNQIITPLWENGYHGFFLDTLDSYTLLKLTPEQNKQQLDGIIDLVKKIKAKYPAANLITNRGFEVLDSIHQNISALAAESLFSGWNNNEKTYETVSDASRKWLLNQLNKAHQDYKLPVIVIDYLPVNQRDEAHKIAKQISSLGFIPWVADGYLNTIGISTIEVIPRKILLLYNQTPKDTNLAETAVYNFTAFILEYMGFIPVLQMADNSLPEGDIKDTYAGIIVWFSKPAVKNYTFLENWLSKQIENKIPIVFMQNFAVPFTSALLKKLNLRVDLTNNGNVKSVKIGFKDKSIGYEILPSTDVTEFHSITSLTGKPLLKLTSGTNLNEDVVAITDWGGYALSPFDMVTLPNGESRWVVNPFVFFRQALRLPEIPAPDVTSANGKRILISQIDGDAFISRVTWKANKFTGEIIFNEILKRYKIPIAVSFIQREFEIIQKNPEIEKQLIKLAQDILLLPWVEVATHTYSHPLRWEHLIEGQTNTASLSYPDSNYLFSYQKEIVGSTEFINTKLAPANKKVNTVLWSGDAILQEKPLEVAYTAGLKNINGMANILSKTNNTLTNLCPLGIYVGNYFHVFSPISNEFQYTDNWAKPLYAFKNVINTFKLTETPVRYKPVSIYYHFYSAADQASLRALKQVYEWAMEQNLIPLQLSEYIDKVMDFNNTVIAKNEDGSWLITNNNTLREFRIPQGRGFPDLSNGNNIIGFNTANNDMYIHLGPNYETRLKLIPSPPTLPYLVDANAEVTEWEVINNTTTKFTLQGYVPLHFKLANLQNCRLLQNNQLVPGSNDNTYSIEGKNSGSFEIQCVPQ